MGVPLVIPLSAAQAIFAFSSCCRLAMQVFFCLVSRALKKQGAERMVASKQKTKATNITSTRVKPYLRDVFIFTKIFSPLSIRIELGF